MNCKVEWHKREWIKAGAFQWVLIVSHENKEIALSFQPEMTDTEEKRAKIAADDSEHVLFAKRQLFRIVNKAR